MGNYLTLSELKAAKDYQGNTIDTSSYTDDELNAMIDEAEELVESICNDKFYSFTSTEYFDGSGNSYLFFPPTVMYNLLSVTSVKNVDFDLTTITTYDESDDFKNWGHYLEINADSSDVRRMTGSTGVWPAGEHNIEVIGTWGWSSTPKNISKAVKLLCMEEIQAGSTGMYPIRIRRKEWEDYTVEFQTRKDDEDSVTGWPKVDRLLSYYINRADFLTMGVFSGKDLDTRP